jgi:hypothetical protein
LSRTESREVKNDLRNPGGNNLKEQRKTIRPSPPPSGTQQKISQEQKIRPVFRLPEALFYSRRGFLREPSSLPMS